MPPSLRASRFHAGDSKSSSSRPRSSTRRGGRSDRGLHGCLGAIAAPRTGPLPKGFSGVSAVALFPQQQPVDADVGDGAEVARDVPCWCATMAAAAPTQARNRAELHVPRAGSVSGPAVAGGIKRPRKRVGGGMGGCRVMPGNKRTVIRIVSGRSIKQRAAHSAPCRSPRTNTHTHRHPFTPQTRLSSHRITPAHWIGLPAWLCSACAAAAVSLQSAVAAVACLPLRLPLSCRFGEDIRPQPAQRSCALRHELGRRPRPSKRPSPAIKEEENFIRMDTQAENPRGSLPNGGRSSCCDGCCEDKGGFLQFGALARFFCARKKKDGVL